MRSLVSPNPLSPFPHLTSVPSPYLTPLPLSMNGEGSRWRGEPLPKDRRFSDKRLPSPGFSLWARVPGAPIRVHAVRAFFLRPPRPPYWYPPK